ncbi:autotransporter outer membrane beta-barrel domain-containing protein [Comamonas sp. SY3]|uniref:autotransporter outer membrane beta-barrel domain-containing protein n=1 Tax=Comamonas sp. SY3 TaxID=3243601 RepID=UPI0035938496
MTSNSQDSVAVIEVDGANSTLSNDGFCAMGGSDTTTMRIANGGTVRCGQHGVIGFGSVTLAGASSKWVIGTDLYMAGSTDMHSTLNIGEGSAVEMGGTMEVPSFADATIPTSATITIDGSTTPGALTASSLVFSPNESGVINLNHSDTSGNYQLATPMTGPGKVYVRGGGTTRLAGDNSYSGTTSIEAGTLRADSPTGFSAASDFVLASGSTLDTHTFSPTVKSLSNAGTVTMTAGGTTGTLTVTGNYSSNGGSVALNTALGDSNSATEKLIINGDTSGTTTLNITNLGGTGAATSGAGILVVQVNGASNGTFSLPAPGYVQAGTFRYDLVKTGNNWYLVSEARAENAPAASVVCSPAELTDAEGQVATCTVSLSTAATADLSINLTVPGANPRYTTTCTSPIVVPANATEASCTITAVANTTADDGDVTAELAIAPPTVADAYTVTGPAAQVVIKDDDRSDGGGDNGGGDNGGGAVPHKVPTMGAAGLMAMASILSLLGLRRVRKDRTPV